jgi:hypothetical protein
MAMCAIRTPDARVGRVAVSPALVTTRVHPCCMRIGGYGRTRQHANDRKAQTESHGVGYHLLAPAKARPSTRVRLGGLRRRRGDAGLLREALTRLARSPAMSAVKGVSASPTEVLFGIGLLMRMLGRIGDDALRRPR